MRYCTLLSLFSWHCYRQFIYSNNNSNNIRIDSKISNKKVKDVLLKYNGCFENCAKDRIDTRIGSFGLSRINEREGTKMNIFSTVCYLPKLQTYYYTFIWSNSNCYLQYYGKCCRATPRG